MIKFIYSSFFFSFHVKYFHSSYEINFSLLAQSPTYFFYNARINFPLEFVKRKKKKTTTRNHRYTTRIKEG